MRLLAFHRRTAILIGQLTLALGCADSTSLDLDAETPTVRAVLVGIVVDGARAPVVGVPVVVRTFRDSDCTREDFGSHPPDTTNVTGGYSFWLYYPFSPPFDGCAAVQATVDGQPIVVTVPVAFRTSPPYDTVRVNIDSSAPPP